MTPLLWELVAGGVGAERATWLLDGLVIHPSLSADGDPAWVSRAVLAQAMGVLLLDDLLARVPSGAAYVGEKVAGGGQVFLDHGAVRTVAGVSCGSLPPGQSSVTRVLSALGYVERETYDLARLHTVGRSWASTDLPADVPQYFVSELDAGSFTLSFKEAAERVLSTSRDPLASTSLAPLAAGGGLPLDEARVVLPVLVSCFNRHHSSPALADYQALLAESEEMAWIATEGTAFNHATDRVADVAHVAVAERAAGRPIKDRVEVSASGRIRQTAHRAAVVTRWFEATPGSHPVALEVPGSFFEFITRDLLPDGSGVDLAFDAANAQQIFSMTHATH